MPTRILQLTDLHLFADPDEQLKGIPTRATFCDVLDHAEAHHGDYELLVITGDLAHDERPETYSVLRELLGERVERCLLLPGNHDDRPAMRQVFPDRLDDGRGPITFSVEVGDWRLIGLDSRLPGEVPGRIDGDQIDWLKEQLGRQPQRPVLVFLHHPPVPVGVPWLDRLGLQEPEALCRLVASSSQVKAVAAGHVHLEFRGQLGQAAVYTTPSTGLQFLPAGQQSQPEASPPGYRVFTLDGDSHRTEVVRLPELKYRPEY